VLGTTAQEYIFCEIVSLNKVVCTMADGDPGMTGINRTGNVRINVTLRRVRASIIAVEKQ
jgi:hypothetical protein